MSGSWMWIVVLGAAAGHALRWVPGNTTMRTVKLPATFALLYVVYAVALAAGGLAGIVIAVVIVEIALRLVLTRPAPGDRRDQVVRRRR
jgi:hypothetical protein